MKHEFKVGDLVRLKDGKRTFPGKDCIGFINDISEYAVYIITPNGRIASFTDCQHEEMGWWEKIGETK